MPSASPFAAAWALDPVVDFLNHGSFGACPRVVLARQQALRAEMERHPVVFLDRRLPDLLDEAREGLAHFVGADSAGVVVVPNATAGVSTVLRSLEPTLRAGDELLTTGHAYNACRNALDYLAVRTGARLVVVPLPFPVGSPGELVERVLAAVGPRTRVALLDHVTSPTALVLPLAELVRELASRGVDTLVDGAHAPGQVPLDLRALGAAWYTGNCHKWLCAPKAVGFLWAREDKREGLRPLVTSHGYNRRRPGRSRLHDEFDWPGTFDPTPFLSVPEAIREVGGLVPGGWPEVMHRNHDLACRARDILLLALGLEAPCPPAMLGSMAALPLPEAPAPIDTEHDALHVALRDRFAIEVPVMRVAAVARRDADGTERVAGCRLLRVSAQLYNEPVQYERLAVALRALL